MTICFGLKDRRQTIITDTSKYCEVQCSAN